MAGASVKVIIFGDVHGHFQNLWKNLDAVNKKQGPFDFAICAGNFLGDDCVVENQQFRSIIQNCCQQSRKTSISSDEALQRVSRLIPISNNNTSTTPLVSHNDTSTTSPFQLSDTLTNPPFQKSDTSKAKESSSCPTSSSLPIDSFLSSDKTFCIPVYFGDSSTSPFGEVLRREFPSGLKLAHNLEYLGGFGLKVINGLKIAYLSGRYDPQHFFAPDFEDCDESLPDAPAEEDMNGQEVGNDANEKHLSENESLIKNGITDNLSANKKSIQVLMHSSLDAEQTPTHPIGADSKSNVTQLPSSPNSNKMIPPFKASSTSFSGDVSSRYFRGPVGAYYSRRVLDEFKALTAREGGSIDLFLTCEWPAQTDTTLPDPQKEELHRLIEFSQRQKVISAYMLAHVDSDNASPVSDVLTLNSGGHMNTSQVPQPSPLDTPCVASPSLLLTSPLPSLTIVPSVSPQVESPLPAFQNVSDTPPVASPQIAEPPTTAATSNSVPTIVSGGHRSDDGPISTTAAAVAPGTITRSTNIPLSEEDLSNTAIDLLMKLSPGSFNVVTSPVISELVEYLEPRYHVACGGGVFYQRPTYKGSRTGFPCRFISLGSFSSSPKPSSDRRLKFIHALLLKPLATMGDKETLKGSNTVSTASPYVNTVTTSREDASPPRSKRNRRSLDSSKTSPSSMISLPGHHSVSHEGDKEEENRSRRDTGGGRNVVICDGSTPIPLVNDPSRLLTTLDVYSPLSKRLKRLSNSSDKCQSEGNHDGLSNSNRLLPGIDESTCRSVYVTNIPYEVDRESFLNIMASFGTIESAMIPTDANERSVGKAWITYSSPSEAKHAVQANQLLESGGRLLKIHYHYNSENDSRANNGIYSNSDRSAGWREFGNSGNSSARPFGRRPPPPPSIDVRPHADCWFCLANPHCEKRLIVSIGEKVYVALAKGGMVHQHVLVVPVTHFPNFVFCPPDVGHELEAYINALRSCYRNQGMAAVIYERYFPMKSTKGMHMQLQVIPIPMKFGKSTSKFFQDKASILGFTLTHLRPGETMAALRPMVSDPIQKAYFYLETPGSDDGEKVERFVFISADSPNQSQQLPFNFGREVIAELMELPQRANWQACVESESTETKLAQQVQKLFLPYQPKT